MPLKIINDDITTLAVDAIVNAANKELKNYALHSGGGVCGAIFRAAGHRRMQASCDAIGGCKTGEAVVTRGFSLPAKYVIHAVGPRYIKGSTVQAALLKSSYVSSLDLAGKMDLKSVAFPLISSGIYGYPKEEALDIALEAIMDWLDEHEDAMTVYLCLRQGTLRSMALETLKKRVGEH